MSERNEELRWLALRFLIDRSTLYHSPQAVRSGLNRLSRQFSLVEIESALEFLRGQQLVESRRDDLGSTHYYKATSTGVLKIERTEHDGN